MYSINMESFALSPSYFSFNSNDWVIAQCCWSSISVLLRLQLVVYKLICLLLIGIYSTGQSKCTKSYWTVTLLTGQLVFFLLQGEGANYI